MRLFKLFNFMPLLLLVTLGSAQAAGKPLDLRPYKGKVVMVDFWASWCPPCKNSFPWLNKMVREKSAQGLVVIGVNVDENSADAKRFLAQIPAKFPIIYDPKGEYPSYYNIPGMPSTIIFDRNGKKVYMHQGFRLTKVMEYEAALNQALKR
ncbi:MAG: TlpA disulfide reductase family protein [Thiofilum sp.]|uniref:TlpA disulfide reductase family protein n=1 Tax=Thiofilum sp. TaxID=2212733 RepID=UPI0025F36536|nr:TlpA disulfide reductase family protein [Thiofilum sp.]MBK8453804.1 TlpA family protein disulfide reductase [Thiofilum sp.]